MKKKLFAIILVLTLLCSSAFTLVSAKNIILGDVNNDSNITAADARLALRASAKLEKLPAEAQIAADVDFNTKIVASDARKILRAAAKIEALPEMPVQETPSTESTTKTSAQKTTKPSPQTIIAPSSQTTTTKPATTKPTTTKPATKPTTTTKPPAPKPTTTKPTTTKPNDDVVKNYPAAIDAFLNGKYYLETKTDSNSNMPEMKIAMNDKGYEVAASAELIEGTPAIELSCLQIKETLYIKYIDASEEKKFFIMDKELQDLLITMADFNIKDMFGSFFEQFDFSSTKVDKYPVRTKGEYDGKKCDIYTFNTEEGKIVFHAIGEEVKRIAVLDKAEAEQTATEVKLLSSDIPANMLSTKGYRAVTIQEFAADLSVLMPDESA